jgi:hypothetical protein
MKDYLNIVSAMLYNIKICGHHSGHSPEWRVGDRGWSCGGSHLVKGLGDGI